jgi:hypothetical protein
LGGEGRCYQHTVLPPASAAPPPHHPPPPTRCAHRPSRRHWAVRGAAHASDACGYPLALSYFSKTHGKTQFWGFASLSRMLQFWKTRKLIGLQNSTFCNHKVVMYSKSALCGISSFLKTCQNCSSTMTLRLHTKWTFRSVSLRDQW